MKRNSFGSAILASAILAAYILIPAGTASAQVLDRPVAIVRLTETVNIGQRELQQQVAALEQQLGETITPAQRREVLEAQIGDVLLDQAAQRAGIRVTQEEIQQAIDLQRQSIGQPVSDAQFRQIVEDQMGLTWDEYVTEITDRLIQEQFILQESSGRFNNLPEPTEREVRQVYEENAQQFTNPAMVRFDHLFLDLRGTTTEEETAARTLATDLARQVRRNDERFTELMRASLDDTRYDGGDFGYLFRGDPQATQTLGGSFMSEVFDLDEGDISGVLESSVGLHVIRVTDRRSPRLLGLDDPLLPGERVTVRQQVRAFILNQRQQQAFQESVEEVLARLEAEAEITRFPENLAW
jgi:peptidyl-prolyl cis-trans isomerase SurA